MSPWYPCVLIADALWSFWSRGQRTERSAYVVGALLIVSGLVHLTLLVVTGAPWQGPLSLRKASTFGLSFGVTLITITWVASFLDLSARGRAISARRVYGCKRDGDSAGVSAGLARRTVTLQSRNDIRRLDRASVGWRRHGPGRADRRVDRCRIQDESEPAHQLAGRDSCRLRNPRRSRGRWGTDDCQRNAAGVSRRSGGGVCDRRSIEADSRRCIARHPGAPGARLVAVLYELERGAQVAD